MGPKANPVYQGSTMPKEKAKIVLLPVDRRRIWEEAITDLANYFYSESLAIQADQNRKRSEIISVLVTFGLSFLTLALSFSGVKSEVATRISAACTMLSSGVLGVLKFQETAKELKAHRDRCLALNQKSEHLWRLVDSKLPRDTISEESLLVDGAREEVRKAAPLIREDRTLIAECFKRAANYFVKRYTSNRTAI
jgi:hypothetical protein